MERITKHHPSPTTLRRMVELRALWTRWSSRAWSSGTCGEGNVPVRDGAVVGLVDQERAFWGDPLIEHGFTG